MKPIKSAITILMCLLLFGCGHSKHIAVQQEHNIYRFIDKVRWYDSTVIVKLPLERVKDIVPTYNLLHMETSLAVAEARLDTASHSLVGEMWNKDEIPTQIRWKERVVYRDSIVTVKEEIPVEVVRERVKYPKTYWILLAFFLGILGLTGYRIYRKFRI